MADKPCVKTEVYVKRARGRHSRGAVTFCTHRYKMGPRNEIGTFSGGGARFCAVSGGSARVWSTDEGGGGAKAPKHEIVPDAHLASPLRPGAVAWLRLHSDTQNAQNTQQASQVILFTRLHVISNITSN